MLASIAAVCMLAVTAGPASAWNTTANGMKLKGTVTVEEGETSVQTTCSFVDNIWQNYSLWDEPEVSYFTGSSGSWINYESLTLSCSGGKTLYFKPEGEAWLDEESGNPLMHLRNSASAPSPFGGWMEGDYDPYSFQTWTNASGGTASHITLDDELIGYGGSYSNPITMSGTISFTTASGGDLTLP